jgi:hypothetical protein
MMSGTQAIPMATQYLDTKDMLVTLQPTDSFLRHPVKGDELRGHGPRILEARRADTLDFDTDSR